MERDLECPFCDRDFVAVEWETEQCPYCGERFQWGEDCTEDYSDCWVTVDWDRHIEAFLKACREEKDDGKS